MSLDLENFDEVKIKGEDLYKTFSEVMSPYFGGKIYFNSEGMEHLKFKRQRKARPRQDQYMRFRLLHLAPLILETSSTLQGICETKNFERVRTNSRTEMVLKCVTYFEFVAVIEKVRVKIIVKQIENGKRIFWSIIPHWGIDKDSKRRKLYSGDLESD